MPIDIHGLSTEQLVTLIENHRRKAVTVAPLYVDALRELEKRRGKGLDFDKSLDLIMQAARKGNFLSYKDLADGSGADWGQVRYSVGAHLWNLVEYADRKGWPLVSAIVVNKQHVNTGDMEPETRKGFIAAARLLGYPVTDEVAFLKEQQARVFEYAKLHWFADDHDQTGS